MALATPLARRALLTARASRAPMSVWAQGMELLRKKVEAEAEAVRKKGEADAMKSEAEAEAVRK